MYVFFTLPFSPFSFLPFLYISPLSISPPLFFFLVISFENKKITHNLQMWTHFLIVVNDERMSTSPVSEYRPFHSLRHQQAKNNSAKAKLGTCIVKWINDTFAKGRLCKKCSLDSVRQNAKHNFRYDISRSALFIFVPFLLLLRGLLI